SPTAAFYIRYRVGAVDEEPGKSGAAHFLEHMMFKGTTTIGTKNYPEEEKLLAQIEETGKALAREKKKGKKSDPKVLKRLGDELSRLQNEHRKLFTPNEIDRLYTENGGLDMNAATGQDLTTYHVNLPANKIELWARIESDRLLHPVFREFYTERDVVMEERRQRVESDPEGKLYENFMSAAYRKHPYGRPILGWARDLMNLHPDDIRKIHGKYKTPGNIVIAVVGDIDIQRTLQIIEKYFSRIPARKEKAIPVASEPQQTSERRIRVKFDASPSLIIGFHKPNAPVYADYVFDVLETILTKGRTSRLYRALVTDSQIAKSVTAINGIPASRYPNLFIIMAQPRHPHSNKELEKAVLREIEKIKNEPVTEEELTRAKKNIRMEYFKSMDSNDEIASTLSYYESLFGDYRYFANYLNEIEKVSADDLQKAAKKYLTKNNRTVATLN
ncbi:MAG TPA: pitrilysin family protein, partial [Smithella sp.]|nr:pitrilysin family protein [Smithella sp.]